MSLSNDKELLKQLLRIAQESPAQAPVVQPATSTTGAPGANAVALKLIKSLQQEALKPASAFTASSDISIKDPKVLRSLDSLLSYLKVNEVKTNNAAIVVAPDNTGKLHPGYANQRIYSAYPKEDSGDPAKYFVYKDGLIAFIRALQTQATNSKNTLVEGLLNTLIGQVNSDFTDMTATEAEKPKVYPNDMQLDLLNPLIPSTGFGTIKLTPPDLASRQTLYAFLKKKNIKFSREGKEIYVDDDINTTIDEALAFMTERATAWAQKRGSDEDKAYLDLVSKLGPSQTSIQAPNTDSGPTKKQSAMAMEGPPWPLFPDKIDIDTSEKFFKWYIDFCNSGTDASAKSTANSFKAYQDKISEFRTRYQGIRVQLLGTEGISQIKNSIYTKSHGRETSVVPYIELLKTTVGGVASALGQLESVFQALNAPIFKRWLTYIQEQKNSYASNLNHLERLEQAAQSDFNNQKAQNGR